jgi:hypothetical protein
MFDGALNAELVPNGVETPRVRCGDEQDDWGASERPCHDCAVIKGEYRLKAAT